MNTHDDNINQQVVNNIMHLTNRQLHFFFDKVWEKYSKVNLFFSYLLLVPEKNVISQVNDVLTFIFIFDLFPL